MEMNLESRQSGELIVIHCCGRIVYREEAVAIWRAVQQALPYSQEVVLDFAQVENVDSAGLGGLVVAHSLAAEQGKVLKIASANSSVQELFELTRLASVFETYPNLAAALETRSWAANA